MEPYTRMLLLFVHAIARRRRSVEVFVFSTRLTRITRPFAGRPIDAALARSRDVVKDWSGGTRIGQALRTFHVQWGRRVLRRGPVVLLISDGWDLGDPELLKAEMARLRRGCFRLIWLNPLIGSPGYEPLTRGCAQRCRTSTISCRCGTWRVSRRSRRTSKRFPSGAGAGRGERPASPRKSDRAIRQGDPWN